MIDNRTDIRSGRYFASTPYQRKAQRPAVQRPTQIRFASNLTPMIVRPPRWWQRRATVLDALVGVALIVVVLIVVAR